jgi:predicted Holliday junction resolvase-like endonuclease
MSLKIVTILDIVVSILVLVYVGEEKEVKKVKERVGANEKRHSRHGKKKGAEAPSLSSQ